MQGQSAEAEGLLLALLQKRPEAEPALTMLVARYERTNRIPAAISLLEKAHGADQGNRRLAATLAGLYLRSGEPRRALPIVNEKGGEASIELLEVKAAVQLALGQTDQAQDTYGRILTLDPAALATRRKLEALLVGMGDYERARNLIKQGLRISPRNYQLYQDYVMLDLKAGGLDAAIATAHELQRQNLDFPAAGALVGDAYIAANRPADAVQAYRTAMKSAPSDLLLARLNAALLRNDQKATALQNLIGWVREHPKDALALQLAADQLIADKQYANATEYLLRWLEMKPHDPVALNNLAWLYQQQGDNRAAELAHQAYILSPGGQTADTLGWILVSGGNLVQGVPLLRQAAEQDSSDPRILYHYGIALKLTGQRDEAIRVLTAVIASQVEFSEKAQARQLLEELSKG
jgi:putative PEP-CTERM system TPR-repeat lipoprotein